MAKKKRKSKAKTRSKSKGRKSTRGRGRNKGFLSGVSTAVSKASQSRTVSDTGTKTALGAASVVGGLIAGLAAGKYSFYSGVAVTGLGVFMKSPYLALAGASMALTPNVKPAATIPATSGSVEGFDVKQIATNAKERIGAYLKGFTEKITFKPQSGMSGLAGDEPVTYFVNPYASRQLAPGSLDMSALDRVQEQIAMMSSGTRGFDEDISARNF